MQEYEELSPPVRALRIHQRLRELTLCMASPGYIIQREDLIEALQLIEYLIRDLEPRG